jgi:hypothetical protein
VAIIAGTEQPKLIKTGVKTFPESPNRRRALSMTKAARKRYPESSSAVSRKKRIIVCGRKESTEDTL